MFNQGEELMLTHANGTSERVRYKKPGPVMAEPVMGGDSYPPPEPSAIVERLDGTELTVVVRRLSQPN